MGNGADQHRYWDAVGATKTFTHPVELDWLADVPPGARILDYGCGYGRVTGALTDQGFTRVIGVDPSPALVERARRARPELRVEVIEQPPTLPPGLGPFDVVLLIAVLTCVVEDEAQRALVAAVTDALVPGGLLYLSDLPLQDDEPSRRRYTAGARADGVAYGVFTTSDGATCRHHDLAHLRALTAHLETVRARQIEVVTMNGNPARAVQMLLRRV